mgnify:CR=1 FL=1
MVPPQQVDGDEGLSGAGDAHEGGGVHEARSGFGDLLEDRLGVRPAFTAFQQNLPDAVARLEAAKRDGLYRPEEDVYRCPAGATLKYHYTNVENGLTLRRYWTTACPSCPIKRQCTPAKERRITRWEHEHILEAVQRRLDEHPEKMRQRRETVEHPFGTIKFWRGQGAPRGRFLAPPRAGA